MAYIEKRVSPKSGKISFRAQVRIKGAPCQTATFKRLTDAREWARNTESAIKERRYFKTAEARKHTVADLIDRHLEYLQRISPKRLKDVDHLLLWWKQELGYCVLADLSKPLIMEAIDTLAMEERVIKSTGVRKRRAPATCNRYIGAFSHVLSIAVTEWEWLEENPMSRIKKFKEPRGRVRFLDDDERERLLSECRQSKSNDLYTIVILALSTGARRSEIMGLRWKNVHLDRATIILEETKNGERRAIYLTGEALRLMQQRSKIRRIDTDLVFPSQSDPLKPYDFWSSWEWALERAGI